MKTMEMEIKHSFQYLNKIIPYLKAIINDLKKFDVRKIQLTIKINFISSKENDE